MAFEKEDTKGSWYESKGYGASYGIMYKNTVSFVQEKFDSAMDLMKNSVGIAVRALPVLGAGAGALEAMHGTEVPAEPTIADASAAKDGTSVTVIAHEVDGQAFTDHAPDAAGAHDAAAEPVTPSAAEHAAAPPPAQEQLAQATQPEHVVVQPLAGHAEAPAPSVTTENDISPAPLSAEHSGHTQIYIANQHESFEPLAAHSDAPAHQFVAANDSAPPAPAEAASPAPSVEIAAHQPDLPAEQVHNGISPVETQQVAHADISAHQPEDPAPQVDHGIEQPQIAQADITPPQQPVAEINPATQSSATIVVAGAGATVGVTAAAVGIGRDEPFLAADKKENLVAMYSKLLDACGFDTQKHSFGSEDICGEQAAEAKNSPIIVAGRQRESNSARA